MDCSNTALTLAKSISLNSDKQFEINFDYNYGTEETEAAGKEAPAGKRRVLEEGEGDSKSQDSDATESVNNIIVKSWDTIFTSNKAKPSDCAPL